MAIWCRVFEVRAPLIDVAAVACALSRDGAALPPASADAGRPGFDRYAELDVAFHLALAEAAHIAPSLLLSTITNLLSDTIRVALYSRLPPTRAPLAMRRC